MLIVDVAGFADFEEPTSLINCLKRLEQLNTVELSLRLLAVINDGIEMYNTIISVMSRFLQRAQCSHCKRCISYGNSVCLSVCLSVRPSVRLSVTRRYCVKTAARSTVQFAPLDSKMCLVL